jgi:hypothetical protein
VTTSYVKSDSKRARKAAKFFGSLFGVVYALLFIPALIYIPLLGAFSLAVDGITTSGAVLCILAFATVPFSMPCSVYLIYKRFVCARYGQMFFFCFLPLICTIIAPLFMQLIIFLYDPELIRSYFNPLADP